MYEDRRFDVLAVKGEGNVHISAKYQNVKLLKAERSYVEVEDSDGNIHIFTGDLAIFLDESGKPGNGDKFV